MAITLQVLISGNNRYLVRPILHEGPFGRTIPLRGWERVTGERLREIETFLKHRNPAPIAA